MYSICQNIINQCLQTFYLNQINKILLLRFNGSVYSLSI